MTRTPKLRARGPATPPGHPRSGGRWLRAADGSLVRATADDEDTPAVPAAASEETN